MAKYWKQHGLTAHKLAPQEVSRALQEKLLGAATSSLSKTQLRQLQYLEEQDLDSLMGFSRQSFCEKMPKEDFPVKGYRKCICNEGQLELVCRARHSDEVNKAVESIRQSFNETQTQLRKQTEGRAAIGPCGSMTCDVASLGVGGNTSPQTDIFNYIMRAIRGKKGAALFPCFSAACSYSWGTPPGACAFSLSLGVGVALGSCRTIGDVLSSFKIGITTSLCLLKDYADVAARIGMSSCEPISAMDYYPFIGKLYASFGLPVFPGIRADLRLNAPVHGLTSPVENDIARSGNPSKKRREYLAAQGTLEIKVQVQSWFFGWHDWPGVSITIGGGGGGGDRRRRRRYLCKGPSCR